MEENKLFEKGLDIMNRMNGNTRDERSGMENDALRTLLCEMGYGKVYSREGLSMRDRAVVTVSALAAMGIEKQLRIHIGNALNSGVTAEELEEIFIHLVLYCGFPRALNANNLLHGVLEQQKEN